MLIRLFFILSFCSCLWLFGNDIREVVAISEPLEQESYSADSIIEAMPPRDAILYPREMKPNYEKSYVGEEFDYTTTKPKKSLIKRLQESLNKLLDSLFGTIPNDISKVVESIIMVLVVVIIAVALYFIIYYFVLSKGNIIFSKKNNRGNINVNELSENIHEINFPKVILDFEQNHNYRSAVRYHYLYILKKLTDRKLIKWTSEKTNKDYLKEFTHESLKDAFGELSHIFDYVWYGEFDIKKEDYKYFKNKFNDFII